MSKETIIFNIPKIPKRYGSYVMPFFLSIFMTSIISLISTFKSIGFAEHFVSIWLQAWCFSWLIAYPVLLLVLPVVRKLTAKVVSAA